MAFVTNQLVIQFRQQGTIINSSPSEGYAMHTAVLKR